MIPPLRLHSAQPAKARRVNDSWKIPYHPVRNGLWALLLVLLGVGSAGAQKATLEFAPGAGNPTGNGPTNANQTITYQNNPDNPTGNTFEAYAPAVKATFSLTQPAGSNTTLFGAGGPNTNSLPLFPHLNNPFGYYSDNAYTSSNAVATGTGISQSSNSSVSLFNAEASIPAGSLSTAAARYPYATLTITFSQKVVNPVIQVTDLGGAFTNNNTTLGFTTDLDLVAAPGVGLSRLSGSSANFSVSPTQIRNTDGTLSSAAHFVSGSVLVTTPATGISMIQFNLYLHGDGGGPWEAGTTGLNIGDLVLLGISQQTPPADVATSIMASTNPVVTGQPLSFNVTYTNNGPGTATGYTQSLQLTPGLGAGNVTFTNLPAGVTATYNNANGVVTFTGTPGSLASGANQNLTVNVLAAPAGVASISASTTVGTTVSQGADTGANSATSTVTVAPLTDVATTLSGPASATQSNQVTLNVTTTNNSGVTALNVVQTVQLAKNLTNVFISNKGAYDLNSGVVTFPTLVSLGGGQTVGNYVSFAAPATAFAPVATVTPNTVATGDSNPANNTAYLNGAAASTSLIITPVPTNAPLANLSTTITPSALAVLPGAPVTFTVQTANAGPSAAANVVETVQLLPGLSALQINGASSTGPGAAGSNELLFANGNKYNTVTGLVTFASIPSLGSAGSTSNTLTFAAPANVGGQLLATASVSSPTVDPVGADNLASAKITVLPTADLAASISGPASVAAGQPIAYTATFTNNGPATVASPTATVQLPAGLTNVSLAGGGTYNPATGVVTFSSLSAATGVSQSYSIVFTPLTAGTYNAAASYSSATPDGVPANNTARTTTTVTPATFADLSVQLSGTAATTFGGAITYVSQTTNNGPSTAAAVTTTIQLPMNLQGTINSSANGSYNAATGVFTFTNGNLANGATVSNFVTYQNNNDPATNPPPFASMARVSSSTTDPNPNNNTSAAVITGTTSDNTPGHAIDLSTTLATNATVLGVNAGNTFTLTPTFTSDVNPNGPVMEVLYLPPGTQVTPSPDFTYNSNSGVLTFVNTVLKLDVNGVPIPDTYTVTVTAPNTGPFTAFSAISGSNFDSNAANNAAATTVTINPAYDEVTSISGPVAALPGVTSAYTVQTINNGPINSGTVVQTVTLPSGVVPSNITGMGIYNPATNTITFPVVSNQAPGTGNIVTNTFTVTMPATGSLAITANVTATGDVNPNNNSTTVTTTQADQPPVANSLVNALQAPRGNSSAAQPISPLSATAGSSPLASYQLTSIPNAATQGTLYYNNGGTLTAITSPTQPLTPAQAASLSFTPVSTFVGNAFFAYTATDNLGTVSLPALYTIQVGQDTNSLYSTTPTKGGTNATGNTSYLNGNVLAYVVDVNGAQYTSAGSLYNPTTGALAAGAANGLPTTGTNVTSPTTTAQFAALGFALNNATGVITVADRTLLKAGSYPLTLTTTDLFGGITTQVVTIVIGARPLPVELTAFTAAAKNLDALLTWSTASERSNDHFDVERSLNGTDFVKIDKVRGQGMSTSATDYARTDVGIGAKANDFVYYRLKQVDTDGTSSYSPVRSIRFGKVVPTIALFPNPTTTATTLDLTALPAGSYQVSVLDAMGRVVLYTTLDAGLAHALQLNTIASGSYTLLVRGANGDQIVNLTKRLIKE